MELCKTRWGYFPYATYTEIIVELKKHSKLDPNNHLLIYILKVSRLDALEAYNDYLNTNIKGSDLLLDCLAYIYQVLQNKRKGLPYGA